MVKSKTAAGGGDQGASQVVTGTSTYELLKSEITSVEGQVGVGAGTVGNCPKFERLENRQATMRVFRIQFSKRTARILKNLNE